MGTTVTYTDVTEDANSADDAPPLFGPPTVAGNALDFDPVGFEASSSGGGAPDITDGQLSFGIEAKVGKAISTLTISEAGDTTLAGFGSNASFTSVTASGVLNIYEANGLPLPPNVGVIAVPFSLTFSPFSGLYRLGTEGGGGPFFHTQWTGGIGIAMGPILLANGINPLQFAVTKLSINLDNTLVAASQDGTTTLIAKKDFGGLSITVDEPVGDIPEPATAVLAGLMSLLAVTFGRRRGC